jgi:hypothetical protein
MLTLLSPAGLWALAALPLPLAIHLWRRPPRVVRLGSLRFLERLTRRRPTDWRWHERVLLAARLLLLTLLALMLARPHWRPPSLDGAQHWILLDSTAAPAGESLARLRALQANGYEIRALASGFPKWTNAANTTRATADLWSLLREADAGLPAGSSLAVFTPGRLSALREDRPALAHCRVEWVITPDRESAVPTPVPQSRAAPLTVLIFSEAARAEDARYVSAAVRAVAQVSGREIALTQTSTAEPGVASVHAGWVFWLANRPPPEALAARAANLVTDAEFGTGGVETTPGWILPQDGVSVAEAWPNSVRLWRRTSAPSDPHAAVLWTDGFGRPLLTRSGTGDHRRWRFFSRFQPDWTDLPRTTALPAWLRTLLLPETNAPLFADPIRDLRRADPAQLPTTVAAATATAVTLPLRRETPGLQGWCWLLAAIIFGLERLLSHRRRAVVRPETNPRPNQPQPALAR